jgi:hypothetical protein
VFNVTAITAMRADGPSARVNGVPAWRRFVVWVRLNPLVDVPTSYWNYRDVSFCLHAGKPWRLTGFDTATSRANYTPYGCQDSAEARLQGGGPSR